MPYINLVHLKLSGISQYIVFQLAPFIQHYTWEIHSCRGSQLRLFILLAVVVDHKFEIQFSVDSPLVIIHSAAAGILYLHFGDYMHTFLLGVYLGVHLLDHRGSLCSALVDGTQTFDGAVPVSSPTCSILDCS